ncbi:unnamed protein product [Blepharisma stoltei]|uniref:Uncharacterized protein n=1 Tax=Blepharisma stoltei TaxID=1481888 RepID=A0AAU9IZZ7_9CILI|nr:unnamed protein product [Blepharisma stoltei]
MDIPKILECLKDFHQNAIVRDEIINFREDIRSLINTSLQKGLLRSIQSKAIAFPEFAKNSYVHKLNNLLPKSTESQNLNIFQQFAKYNTKIKPKISIPTTLLKMDNISVPFALFTSQNGSIEVQSSEIVEDDFFEPFTNKRSSFIPLFCYKLKSKGVSLLFSADDAKKTWKSAESNALLQYFINCKSNPQSIIRVVWRKCTTSKYYTIINRSKTIYRSFKNPQRNKKRAMTLNKSYSNLCDFKYRNMIQPLSQSVNNPFKLKSKPQEFIRSGLVRSRTEIPHKSNKTNNFPLEASLSSECILEEDDLSVQEKSFSLDEIIFNDARDRGFVVNTKEIESCYGIEVNTKIPQIEKMLEEIVNFLSTQVFYQQGVGGIVLDFIQDKNQNWFFLECNEYFIDSKLPIEIGRMKNKQMKILKTRRARSFDETVKKKSEGRAKENSLQRVREEVKNENMLPFKIRKKASKVNKASIDSEKELLVRYNTINEKLNKIISSKKLVFSKNCLDEPSNNYPINSNFSSPYNDKKSSQIYQFQASKKKLLNKQIDSLWNDKQHAYTKKCFSDTVDHFDEIISKIKMAKTGFKNLVEKYGGSEFWDSFIVSLYNQILSSETLSRHFKNSQLKDFARIHSGIFQIFSGSVGLELRRKIRSVHHHLGISERDFDCYTEIFFKTLDEYRVQEEDKQLIASQIKSMKGLICKQAQ